MEHRMEQMINELNESELRQVMQIVVKRLNRIAPKPDLPVPDEGSRQRKVVCPAPQCSYTIRTSTKQLNRAIPFCPKCGLQMIPASGAEADSTLEPVERVVHPNGVAITGQATGNQVVEELKVALIRRDALKDAGLKKSDPALIKANDRVEELQRKIAGIL